MAMNWMALVMKRMVASWTTTTELGTEPTVPVAPPARQPGGDHTPDGVASWLSFHGIDVQKPRAPIPVTRRPT